jgi:hypothetical protein
MVNRGLTGLLFREKTIVRPFCVVEGVARFAICCKLASSPRGTAIWGRWSGWPAGRFPAGNAALRWCLAVGFALPSRHACQRCCDRRMLPHGSCERITIGGRSSRVVDGRLQWLVDCAGVVKAWVVNRFGFATLEPSMQMLAPAPEMPRLLQGHCLDRARLCFQVSASGASAHSA